MFVGHIVNETYNFYLLVINSNTLSLVVPIWRRSSLFDNLKELELMIQNLEVIACYW